MGRRDRVEQLTERAKDNIQQKTAHMPECMLKLESASGRVFELLSRETSWPPDSTAPCVHMNFLDFCPQPIQRQHTLLPQGLCPYPTTGPASPSPSAIVCSQYKFFQNDLRLSSPNSLIKGPIKPRTVHMLPFPSSPALGDSGRVPQNPILLLVSTGLNKPFLSGKIS